MANLVSLTKYIELEEHMWYQNDKLDDPDNMPPDKNVNTFLIPILS